MKIPAAAVLAILGLASSLTAQTYDAADDFAAFNPSGVWSYGYTETAAHDSALLSMGNYNETSTLAIWSGVTDPPSVVKNISGGTIEGILPGQIALHPGPDNQNAVLTFTAPSTGSYSFSIQFFEGASGETDAYIFLNEDFADPIYFTTSTTGNPQFIDVLSLNETDQVKIMIGSLGSYNSDTTPINAVVTVVPEPGTAMLLAVGALGLFVRRARSRR